MNSILLLLSTLLVLAPAHAGEAEDALQQAESLLEQGLPSEALGPMRKAARLSPGDVVVQRKYMELMKSQGYGRDAVAEFQARLEASPDDPLAHYLFGVSTGDPPTARREFEAALELDPNHAWARQGLGSVAIAEGRFEEALTHYQQALTIDPSFAEVHNKVANLHVALGQTDEAKAAWKRAMAAAPDDHHAYMNMGAALSMDGDLQGAAELLQGAVQRAPGNARVHFNYAYVLFKVDRVDDSLAHFAAALAINPRDRTVRGTQALVEAVRDGSVPRTVVEPYEQAVASLLADPSLSAQKYKEVLLLAPDFAFAHMNLGVAQAALGEVDAAKESLTTATRLAAEDPDTWRNLGMYFLMVQQYGEAIAPLSTAQGLDPSDPTLLSALANAQLGAGKASESVVSYRRALSLRPRDPALHVEMAAAQSAAGDLTGAAKTARSALAIAPEMVPARVQLVAILRDARRFDEALTELDVLDQQIPGHPDVVSQRTIIEARRGAHREQAKSGKIRLSRILVGDEALAQDLVQQARGGADFGALAQRHSSGPFSAVGGDIGYVDAKDLLPDLAKAVAQLERGGVASPVQVGANWLIVKRVE